MYSNSDARLASEADQTLMIYSAVKLRLLRCHTGTPVTRPSIDTRMRVQNAHTHRIQVCMQTSAQLRDDDGVSSLSHY